MGLVEVAHPITGIEAYAIEMEIVYMLCSCLILPCILRSTPDPARRLR